MGTRHPFHDPRRSPRGGGPDGGFPGGFGAGFPGGFGGGFGRGGRGRRGRNRGDVRNALLALLAEEPMHGYQMIQAIAERTDGAWTPSPGSVYPTIAQLADEGLARSEKADGRSVVHLTEAGEQHVAEHREELAGVWDAVGDRGTGHGELRGAVHGLVGAAMQVGQAGRPEQVAEAVAVLEDARRRLYLVLAGEEPTGPTDR